MALTGYPQQTPQMCPVPLASYADGILAALGELRPHSPVSHLDGAQLLGERAALGGYRRGGDIAPGGSCRLLPLEDGWLAVNLARTQRLADAAGVARGRRHCRLGRVGRGA